MYKADYEKTKAKNHIPPDMLDVLSARQTQNYVSEIGYRKHLHQWICMPDMQVYVQARKVNEQLSDVSHPNFEYFNQLSLCGKLYTLGSHIAFNHNFMGS